MTEKLRAPIEVLERLAEAVDEYWDRPGDSKPLHTVRVALNAYRAATAPLRTRASVDAEIATVIRDYHRHITRPGWKETPDWDSFSTGMKNDLNRLCSEPTSDDHGSSSTPAAKESRDNAGVSAGPTNEPEACSCDQALELQRIVSHVHALALELVQVTETTPP